MARFVLRFTEKPEEAEPHVKAVRGAVILDSSSRMFLVDGPEAELQHLANARRWTLAKESATPAPKQPRPQLANAKERPPRRR